MDGRGYAIARRQNGVILVELRTLGISRRTQQRRVREGAGMRLQRGVLVTTDILVNRLT